MREKLEYQADLIEAVLATHRVPARVTGGTVTPRWVRFQILPAVGAKISKIKNLSEELAAALDAPNCRVSRQGAAVAIEVPRGDPQPVRLLPLFRQVENDEGGFPAIAAMLGLAEDGAPLLIRLPSPDVAHILVAGTTGSGKTVLLQTMALSLAMANRPPLSGGSQPGKRGRELSLVLIDPKGVAFAPLGRLPHLARPIVRGAEETIEALNSLVRLMERRTPGTGLEPGTARSQPHVVVMIDELADLLMVGGKPIQHALTRLTQRGREAGIHVVAATQKPTSALVGSLVKANFPVRLVGRVTSIEDARTATGWSGTGAERLVGRGDFLAVAEGRVMRFQVAHVAPDEMHEVASHLARGVSGADAEAERAPARQIPLALPRPLVRLTEALAGGIN